VVGGTVVVVVGGAVVVVGGGAVVVVGGGSVVVVVGGSVVVVVGGSVDVVGGGSVEGVVVDDVASGDWQSTGGWFGSGGGWFGSAGGQSCAPAVTVANGIAGPSPEPAAPTRTAPVNRATVIRRWVADVDTASPTHSCKEPSGDGVAAPGPGTGCCRRYGSDFVT